jgi:hypothetical protein
LIDLNTPHEGAGNEGNTSASTDAHSINFKTMKKLLKNDWFNLFWTFGLFIATAAYWGVGAFLIIAYFAAWVLTKD